MSDNDAADRLWSDYDQSLERLVLVGEPRDVQIMAAWVAGGGSGPVPTPLTPSPYLDVQLREAFRLASGDA